MDIDGKCINYVIFRLRNMNITRMLLTYVHDGKLRFRVNCIDSRRSRGQYTHKNASISLYSKLCMLCSYVVM